VAVTKSGFLECRLAEIFKSQMLLNFLFSIFFEADRLLGLSASGRHKVWPSGVSTCRIFKSQIAMKFPVCNFYEADFFGLSASGCHKVWLSGVSTHVPVLRRYNFSKVSPLLNLLCKIAVGLSFQNFDLCCGTAPGLAPLQARMMGKCT